ncbi:MAG: hypothetical protein ABIP33_05110 [Pseudolysinimonas sp.]
MEHRTRFQTSVKREGADAGQAPTHAPCSKHVPSFRRAGKPPVANPDHLALIPSGKVDPSRVYAIDEQLAPTGEPFVTLNNSKEKIHAVTLSRMSSREPSQRELVIIAAALWL